MALLLTAVLALAAFLPQQALPAELSRAEPMLDEWSGKDAFASNATSETTITVVKALGGRYIHANHRLKFGETVIEGQHMITYDTTEKVWRSWWFESGGFGVMETEGSLKDGTFALISKPVRSAGKSDMPVYRLKLTVKGDSMDFEMDIRDENEWKRVITGAYKRKGPGA